MKAPIDFRRLSFITLVVLGSRWVGQEGIGRLVKYTQSTSLVVRTLVCTEDEDLLPVWVIVNTERS